MLLTPPRCLTANRTQQGVLLTWIPPANHTAPIQHYVMEFRLGERWEVLDDSIPAGETELLARDLIQVKDRTLKGCLEWGVKGLKSRIYASLKTHTEVFMI